MEQAQRYVKKRGHGLEWDLNDWKWDGDLFIATPCNGFDVGRGHGQQHQQFIPVGGVNGNSSNSSSSCSDYTAQPQVRRGRAVLVEEEESSFDDHSGGGGALSLKLGGGGIGVGAAVNNNKKAKVGVVGGSAVPGSRAVCQVEDCGADLSKAKDYHRRHKVCELHSKATKALVGNVMQRFCQQCSRFHHLQEFDEGKRSCRRRLAGHNKRRRKTQPDAPANQANSMNDDQTNSVLLLSLLRILSNMHANSTGDQPADQDLIAQLLRGLANPSSLHAGRDISSLLLDSQKLLNGENPRGMNAVNSRVAESHMAASQKPEIMFPIKDSPPAYSDSTAGRMKLNNFDLNDAYVDSDDGTEDLDRSPLNLNSATGSPDFPSWARQDSHQSSPPQTSGNSDSASTQSPSSSSGEAQSRTDRIVFKLFGKEPSEFPMVLRGQILDWLAHSPTDIESYIRPGCIILTIYLRLAESVWEELHSDLSSCLTRLFDISDDTFWRTGWVSVRLQNQFAFRYNGQAVLNTSIPPYDTSCSRIMSVKPIAVPISEQVMFEVTGSNLSRSTTRLLCALDGKYLDQETTQESEEDSDTELDDEIEHVNVSCSIPNTVGRGFIEVEDYGLSSSFFPFIVAEKEVCWEIQTLESVLELKDTPEGFYETNGKSEARDQAMDFINEMGWLLHRGHLKSRLGSLNPDVVTFSFERFKWLVDFSMDRDWCAVVKKLLDILVSGTVGTGDHPSLKVALSELGLLHRAVRRNSRSMVERLLTYVPAVILRELESSTGVGEESFLFTPDVQGPAGLTPLHVAAGRDGSEDVLDALTNDPGKVGIEAWKNARDSTGATPEDYARLRGHYTYIHLVQRKINRISASTSGHLVVDIDTPAGEPSAVSDAPKQGVAAASFEITRSVSSALKQSCKLCCDQKMMGYYRTSRASLVYRPAMLSLVAIAAVCVCVALLFKSMPNVVCLFRPFRWELLGYGTS